MPNNKGGGGSDGSGQPDLISVFIKLGFEYDDEKVLGRNAKGTCIFCGKRDHLYINLDSGQWDCKKCGRSGNVYTFMGEWYELFIGEQDNPNNSKQWKALAENRSLDVQTLKNAGIVYDGEQFVVPIKNIDGKIINLCSYSMANNRLYNLPIIDVGLFGLEHWVEKGKIYICEGPWDMIALKDLLERESEEGLVLAVPGASIFKSDWKKHFEGHRLIICYDHDLAGERGTERVYELLRSTVQNIQYLKWDESLAAGYDIKDYVVSGGTVEGLNKYIRPYASAREIQDAKSLGPKISVSSKERPTFNEVMAVYKKHLHMTKDLEDALKVVYAVILTSSIPSSPLWVHIVGPPGSGKTLILMSTAEASIVYPVSTLSPNALVSGFVAKEDPSLIPKLDGKTLLIKDFTEILSRPKIEKDSIYGILRGAYDGNVSRPYGNGKTVEYISHFNQVTGVTQQIYSDRSATLGERYLMFHVVKGVGFDSRNEIMSALKNVGKASKVNTELSDAARDFLDVIVTEADLPDVPDWIMERVVNLAQFVAMLRASVDRDLRTRNMTARPQHETGTRIAEQFYKCLLGLGLINNPSVVGEEEYRILARIAIDTCVGFNLEAIASLVQKGGKTLRELAEDCNLPLSTLSDQLDDLRELGAVTVIKVPNPAGRGAPHSLFYASDRVKELWKGSALARENGQVKALQRVRRSLKVKMKRTK